MEVTGKIHKIMDVQNLKNDFKKREFVLLYAENEQYPQYVKFEIFGDKVSMLDSYKEKDEVKIYFDLRGREWENPEGNMVYFTTLGVWKMEKLGNGNSKSQQSPSPVSSANPDEPQKNPEDDLPF